MRNIQKPCVAKQFEIKRLSNQELLSQTKVLVQKERRIHIQVLHHLREIESRKLYFSQGFSSLFDYAVKELGYSEGAAYRRIKAMRLCRDMPGTEGRLQSGRLSLSSACQLQNFFEKQAKKSSYESVKQRENAFQEGNRKNSGKVDSFGAVQQLGDSENSWSQNDLKGPFIPPMAREEEQPVKPLSVQQKQQFLEKVEGCSTRETERLLSEAAPSLSVSREKVRFLGKDKVEIKTVIDKDCYRKLEELKNLLSHKNPSLSCGRLLTILVDEGLRKHDPCRKGNRKRDIRADNISEKMVASAQKLRKTEVVTGISLKERRQTETVPIILIQRRKQPKMVASGKKLRQSGDVTVTSAPKLGQKGDISVSKCVSVPEKLTVKVNGKPGTVKSQLIRRAVPAQIRRDIWARDRGRCTYVNPKTKRRCGSRYLLQIDHIKPFALGGGSERENLRLLCAGHNRFCSGSVQGTLP